MDALYGIKQTMSQAWLEDSRRVPVTMVKVDPLIVTQVKTSEKDKYQALQLGFSTKKIKNITKPLQGHLKKIQNSIRQSADKTQISKLPRYLKEVRIPKTDQPPSVGDLVKASDILSPGDLIKVSGISKGKGFIGGVKRWGFSGGPKTHGQSDRERAPGSIGQGTTPGRVYKGKKMAGRMGGQKATVKNLTVVDVSDNIIMVSGLIPGVRGSVVYIEKIGHNKKFPGIRKINADKPNAESLEQNQENIPQEEMKGRIK